jgi:hypothetical protein
VPDDGVADGPAHDNTHPGRVVPTDRRRVHDKSTARRTSPAYCGAELVRAAHSIDLGKHTTSVVRRRDGCGPCGAVRRGSPCRRACASAAGTRASCCDGGCSVETYAYSRGLAPIFTVDRHGGRMVLGRVAPCCTAASTAARKRCCTTRVHTHGQRRRPADFPTVRGGSTGVKPARGCLYTGRNPARSDTPRGLAEERSLLRLACGERLVLHPQLLLASGAGHEVLSRRLQRHLGHTPSQLCTACGQPCGCGLRRPPAGR